MKKLLSLMVLCLMALTMTAQRAAVLEFKAGVGVSQADVDGLCGMFTTGFRPAGYTIIERSQIDRIISEQNMQRSNLTEYQMIRIGELLNLSCIVIGDVNVVMGEYNVDVRVINVESGVVIATAGKAFTGSYGENMRTLAQTLAGKIAIKPGQTVHATPTPTSTQPAPQPSEPLVLYGYLKVFPNDLGTFYSEPTTVIANINKSQQYGYGTWRLPTVEELNLMRANNLISGYEYMSSDGRSSGKVRLVTDKQKGPVVPAGYVDLGLPSGTLWKDKNESGGFYTYDEAMKAFGNNLPTKEQFEELKSSCKWTWTGNGYKVVGPSGASITLPVAGYRFDSAVYGVRDYGDYWSSTPNGSGKACDFNFSSGRYGVYDSSRDYGFSVRLVAVPQN
ncbi:MAG: DUF1566 domain-containing protein [Bacteroidales bacterium]|nr:DUF1566 domain-containing protein [Bacteroidales bacterium]